MSDEFDPVEAIRRGAGALDGLGPQFGFTHNEDRWVAAMLQGADQLEAAEDVIELARAYLAAEEHLRSVGHADRQIVMDAADDRDVAQNTLRRALGAGE